MVLIIAALSLANANVIAEPILQGHRLGTGDVSIAGRASQKGQIFQAHYHEIDRFYAPDAQRPPLKPEADKGRLWLAFKDPVTGRRAGLEVAFVHPQYGVPAVQACTDTESLAFDPQGFILAGIPDPEGGLTRDFSTYSTGFENTGHWKPSRGRRLGSGTVEAFGNGYGVKTGWRGKFKGKLRSMDGKTVEVAGSFSLSFPYDYKPGTSCTGKVDKDIVGEY